MTICREVRNRQGEGISLIQLGSVMLTQSKLQLAQICYQEALIIHQELNQPHHLVEDWASLARVKLIEGDQKNAWIYAQQVLDSLQVNPQLHGAENPMRTFRFTWEALVALGLTTKANEVLSLAAQVMQLYLDKNSDPAMQEMYLRQPHHRVLWAAWQEKQTAD